MQARQLLLEPLGGERQSCIELERLREHLRRQRPAPPLELRRYLAVEVEDEDDVGENRKKRDDEEDASPATRSRTLR